MNELISIGRAIVELTSALLAQPNTITVISVSLLLLVGRQHWKAVDERIKLTDQKVADCELRHGRCDRRLSYVIRMMHGALKVEEAALDPRRSGIRRVEDMARLEALATMNASLDAILEEIERESREEERLATTQPVRK